MNVDQAEPVLFVSAPGSPRLGPLARRRMRYGDRPLPGASAISRPRTPPPSPWSRNGTRRRSINRRSIRRCLSRVAAPPVNDGGLPEIIGTLQVGSTLAAANGGWTGAGLTFTRRWFRDSVVIPGATSQAYTLVPADEAAMMTVEVTGTNAGGSATGISDPEGPVAPAPPLTRRALRR